MQRLARIAALYCVIATTLPAGPAHSEPANPSCRKGAPSGFLGSEVLRFAVNIFGGFLFEWIDAAEADIFAKELKGTSPSVVYTGLTANTKGFVFFASGGMYQEHRSRAVEMPDKNGTMSYATTDYHFFQRGGNNPQILTFQADYEKSKLIRSRRAPPESKEIRFESQIPRGLRYVDPLTVLFNFRKGRYRFPSEGEEIVIKTFPFEDDGASYDEIKIRRANKEKEENYRINYAAGRPGTLMTVDVPSGFLRESRRILVKVWFDNATLTPRWARAFSVVPFLDGDAVGSFVCFGNSN